MRKIGFFAGSFDPIHDGHIEVAKTAVRDLGLDELCIMVERRPWGVKSPVGIEDRIAMVDLATTPYGPIRQLILEDETFNMDITLPKLEQEFHGCELYFVFGADVFATMDPYTWRGLDELTVHNLVIFERKKLSKHDIKSHADTIGVEVDILSSVHPHHSSTDVRVNVYDRAIWVPEVVEGYINDNDLYAD